MTHIQGGDEGARRSALADPGPRQAFIARIASCLDEAGVEYVFLHGYGADHHRDSDVDVAIDRSSLAAVDVLLRAGTLGKLVQRLDYGTPWCRYYIVASSDRSHPYRQLDVVCDPWGLGPYGRSIALALGSAQIDEIGRRPRAAEETFYLTVKRAHKGVETDTDRARIIRCFARSPNRARRLLEQELGVAGRVVADELERGVLSDEALARVRQVTSARLKSAPVLTRRAAFAARRIVSRVTHPTGLVICLAGPDGVGKSALADRLAGTEYRQFRRTVRLHVGPGLLPPPGRLLGRASTQSTEPHLREPSGLLGSTLRAGYLWSDFVLGWIPRVTVPRIRSSLVILERGWGDLEIDPLRYRLSLPLAIYRWLGWALPRPDATLVLNADPATVERRKPELAIPEIERQLDLWLRRVKADPHRFAVLDAELPLEDVEQQATAVIERHLAARQLNLEPARLALRAMGVPSRTGVPYAIVTVRGAPRWIVPSGIGKPGPWRRRLYRPATIGHAARALTLELLLVAGMVRPGHRVRADSSRGMAGCISELLGCEVELAAAATSISSRGQRAVMGVRSRDGRSLGFAKVAVEEGEKLRHEWAVLQALKDAPLERLSPPDPIGLLEWEDAVILVLRPFHSSGRAERAVGDLEIAGLAELVALGEYLKPVISQRDGEVPVHGDFAPWNCGVAPDGRLALWDWEDARLGLPLEDLFHWQFQRFLRDDGSTLEQIVTMAIEPGDEIRRAAAALGVNADIAPLALRSYLEHSLEMSQGPGLEHVRAEQARALAVLFAMGG